MPDLRLTADYDLAIASNGDLAVFDANDGEARGDAVAQRQRVLLLSTPGNLPQNPVLGGGLMTLRKAPITTTLAQRVQARGKTTLQAAGFDVTRYRLGPSKSDPRTLVVQVNATQNGTNN